MGKAFQAQMHLTQKMLKVNMSMQMQTANMANITGAGGTFDVIG